VTYYAREGPVGQIFSIHRDTSGGVPSRIAAIGLGAGALSCFVGAEQRMTFYEIDPVEAKLAQDPRYFSYLSSCARGPVDIVIGDGRLNIAKAPDGLYDLIFVDAFSGDAIPVHLLTKEATELYFRKLAPKGMVLFHITNTYIDLLPVVANIVESLGLHARHVDYHEAMMTPFALPSEWVVVARPGENDLQRFGWQMVPWDSPVPDPRIGVWTDDYSNVIRSLRWDQYGVVH
jgi:spermidine synthase